MTARNTLNSQSAAYDALSLAPGSEGNSSQPAVSSPPNSSVAQAASSDSLSVFSPTSPAFLAAVANAVQQVLSAQQTASFPVSSSSTSVAISGGVPAPPSHTSQLAAQASSFAASGAGFAAATSAMATSVASGRENFKIQGKRGVPGPNEFIPVDPQDFDERNLTSVESHEAQLQEFRLCYEEKIANVEKEKEEQVNALKEKLVEKQEQYSALEKKYKQLKAVADKLASQLQEKIKDINDLKDQMRDLKDQMTDLMHHMDIQQRVANSPDETRQELQDGTISLANPGSSTG